MGLRVPENKGSAVHGEVRPLTFCLFTDHEGAYIELPWEEFADLERIIQELAERHPHRDWPWERRGHVRRMAEQLDPSTPDDITPVVPRQRPVINIKKKGERE